MSRNKLSNNNYNNNRKKDQNNKMDILLKFGMTNTNRLILISVAKYIVLNT